MLKMSAATADVLTPMTDPDDAARLLAQVLEPTAAAEAAAGSAVLAARLAQARLDVRSFLASRGSRLAG
jgi:hypothetical protein